MNSESCDPDEEPEVDLGWHREMDRIVGEWDDEPTHEKYRRGAKWR